MISDGPGFWAGHTWSGVISRRHIVRGILSCYVSPKEADHGVGWGDLEADNEKAWGKELGLINAVAERQSSEKLGSIPRSALSLLCNLGPFF